MSRHRFLYFDKSEHSQFRLRAPKTTKNLSINHKNISSKHLNDLNYFLLSQDNSDELQQNNSDEFPSWQHENCSNNESSDNYEPESNSWNNEQYENNLYDTNSESDNYEEEMFFTDIDNATGIFDDTIFDLTWNQESQFGTFENFTTMVMFVWVMKYLISIAAYQDLIEILLHSQFERNYLNINLQKLKKYHEKLPLMQIQRVLSESGEELWEGNLWAESPLFSQSNLTTLRDSFKSGNFVQYVFQNNLEYGRIQSFVTKDNSMKAQIQKIIPYSKIPHNLHSEEHVLQYQHEWFLVEKQPYLIVEPSSLTQKIIAWLKDQSPPQHFDLSINRILYHFNGYWKIRSIKLRNQHPAEYISENLPPDSTMPILKIFLDLYYDDFGTFRNIYHSLGGVYLQIGNMPRQMRKQLRNYFVIDFVPFGGDFKDFIKHFLYEIKKLERGFIINLNGINYWITGGLGVFTADLPQGNDIAGTLRHNAYRGCRTCKASKDQLTDLSFDLYYYGRYHQLKNQEFQLINRQSSNNAKSRLCSQYGLRYSPGPLDSLLYNRHLHMPQDAYHAIAGKAARLLDCTCSILTLYGENNLINYWKNIEVPSQWSRLPNPITHRRSFMMSDNLRILMIFPFILKYCLTINSIKDDFLKSTCRRLHFFCRSEVRDYIIYTWALCAKAAKKVFSLTMQRFNGYSSLQTALNDELDALIKAIVPHTNMHNLELTLLRQINTLQTLRYLADESDQLQIEDDSIITTNSGLFNCSEIKLGRRWTRYQIEAKGFISTNIEQNGLLKDIMKASIEARVYFYENVAYKITKDNGDYYNIKLKVGEMVEATLI
ncbi:25662_t:CDS:2, partial [Gigaspora margarita]